MNSAWWNTPTLPLEELELAYAVTIHKSQGSEYPAIVIPLLSGPRMLMTRNLLYTAVTRARKCVTLVGDERTFTQMIDNTMEQKRYTALAARIQEHFGNVNGRISRRTSDKKIPGREHGIYLWREPKRNLHRCSFGKRQERRYFACSIRRAVFYATRFW